MIKQLKKYDIQTTPFLATKDWHLLNVQHQDLVILERRSGSYVGGPPELDSSWNYTIIPETDVALEFVDYSFGNPYGIINTECNIALEQQQYDPVIYEEGISGSGLFYPDDLKNLTGTYKRLMYQQILRAFYNNYHNPLQIFGMEKFDFQTSVMRRYLSNYFKVFTLPQQKFGDKIQEGSVLFVDNSFDDNYTVEDDCQGNLVASPNLFSRIQEVRHIENIFVDGVSLHECPAAIITPPITTGSFSVLANLTAPISTDLALMSQVPPFTMSLDWTDPFDNESGFYLYMAVRETTASLWSDYSQVFVTPANVTSSVFYYNYPMVSASFYIKAYNGLGLSDPSNTVIMAVTSSWIGAIRWEIWTDVWSNLTGSWGMYS